MSVSIQQSTENKPGPAVPVPGPVFRATPLRWLPALMALLSPFAAPRAQVVQINPAFKDRIDVIEHLGDRIDLNLPLIDASGDTVPLGSQFSGGLPVVFMFFYSDCPMLCGLVLNGVSAVTRESDLVPGKDYRIVSVSLNPRENPGRSEASETRFDAELPESAVGNPWRFFTADQTVIDSLTKQVGFKYDYDPKLDQYMHPAVIETMSADGAIARYLYGIEYNPRDFRLGIVEASQGTIGTTVDRVLLYCMHYDPDAESYVVVAAQVMKLGGLATVAILGLVIGSLWFKERRRGHATV